MADHRDECLQYRISVIGTAAHYRGIITDL